MNPYIHPSLGSYYEDNPLTIVDIGAMGGINERWSCCSKYLRVIGFEPDERVFKELTGKNRKKENRINTLYLNAALYNAQNEINFYTTKKRGNSSVLLPNKEILNKFPDQNRFEVLNTIKIKVDSLDNQLKKNFVTDIDFIKVDTQGSELYILQGAADALKKSVFGLEIEVEFIELYKNQPLFSDIDNFLKPFGFQLFDLRKTYWKRQTGKNVKGGKGQVIFGDALYLKQEDIFLESLSGFQKEKAKSKILKAISICIIFGYLDYALVLSKEAFKRNILLSHEDKLIEDKILSNRKMPHIPDFKGKQKLAMIFYNLYKLLRQSRQNSWAVSDVEIGNAE